MVFLFPQKNNFRKVLKRVVSFLFIFCFILEQAGFAQVLPQFPVPVYNNLVSSVDKFHPIHLRYLDFDQATRHFNVLIDKGDVKGSQQPAMEQTARDLMTCFLVGVRLPNSSFWVNLRPDSPDRIIDDSLARTDIGRIMLAADVQLKKDLAAYTSPKTKEGREYWNKLYKKAEELFGNEDISIPTVTRPWIVPNEIILRQTGTDAYIYKATLKVLLESDYLKDNPSHQFEDGRFKTLNDYSSQLIKESIIPKLSKDVNISRRYAPLRQVYYSLILAQWYKAQFSNAQESGMGIDGQDLAGLTSAAAWSKETYFEQYRESFTNGEYNIQDAVQTPYGQTIRQYFSGGIQISRLDPVTTDSPASAKPDGILAISANAAMDPARFMKDPQRADITVRDGGFDLKLFLDEIAAGVAGGNIVMPQGTLKDDYSIFKKGFDWTNMRRLPLTAAFLLKELLERNQRSLRVLSLGPGSGIELTDIDKIARAQKYPVKIDTISLTALPPRFRLTKDLWDLRNMLLEYIQDPRRDLSGLAELYEEIYDGPARGPAGKGAPITRPEFIRAIKDQADDIHIPLSAVFQLQSAGFPVYDELPEPFINQQLIVSLKDSARPGIGLSKAYDVMVDNHGGFYYTVQQDGLEAAVLAVEPLLDTDGIFYAEHIMWREDDTKGLEFDNVLFFVQSGNPSSIVIIRKDSAYAQQALDWVRNVPAASDACPHRLSESVYRVNSIDDLLRSVILKDGGASSRKGLSTVEADNHPSVGAPVFPVTLESFSVWLGSASTERINRRISFLESLEKIIRPALASLSSDVLQADSETLGSLIESGVVTADEVYRLLDYLGTGNGDTDSPGFAQNVQMIQSFIRMKSGSLEPVKAGDQTVDDLRAGLADSNVYARTRAAHAIWAAIKSGRVGGEEISGIDMSLLNEIVPLQDQKYFLMLLLELRDDRESAYRISEYLTPGLIKLAHLADYPEVHEFFCKTLAQCIRDNVAPAAARRIMEKELQIFIIQKISAYRNADRSESGKASLVRHSMILGVLVALILRDKGAIEVETARAAFTLTDIAFKDRGSSFSTASYISEQCLNGMPVFEPEKPLIDTPVFTSRSVVSIPELDTPDISRIISNAKPMVLGRTTVFQVQGGRYIAFKALKHNEDPGRLVYESEIFDYMLSLKEKGMDLQAEYPRAYLIKGARAVRIRSDDIPEGLKGLLASGMELDTTGGYYTIMAYSTDGPGYFSYLHEMQDDALADDAALKCIHDLFVFARHGLIHPDIIELFHNLQAHRQDNGRYLWNADTVKPMGLKTGAGRLHAWEDTVKYPNLRISGPADFAELVRLSDLVSMRNQHSYALRDNLERFNAFKREKFILAHFQGNYMLAWALNEGKRLRQKNGLDWREPSLLASRVRRMYSEAFKAFTGKDDTDISELVDWNRFARQMAYFMSGDYVPDLVNKNIPEEIYGPGTEIGYSPDLEASRGWTPSGWMSDGKNADLGPVNGPLPLQEMVKANYIYTMFMIGEFITDHNAAKKDGGKTAVGLDTYREDIASASARGDIVRMPMRGVEDEYSPAAGLTTTNTRGLSLIGRRLVEIILSRHNGNGDAPVSVLVLGHGSGRECALIKTLAQEYNKPVVIDALGLSEISPSISLTRSADEIKLLIDGYIKEHQDIPLGWKRMSGSVSLITAFDMHNKGYDIFRSFDEPFIRTQFIGLFHTAAVGRKYDLIYDNFGPFWYSTKEQGLRKTLDKIVGMLSAQGVFYTEHMPEVDRSYLGGFPDNKIIAINSGSVDKLLVCNRESWFGLGVARAKGEAVYTGPGHEIMSLHDVLAMFDGGAGGPAPEAVPVGGSSAADGGAPIAQIVTLFGLDDIARTPGISVSEPRYYQGYSARTATIAPGTQVPGNVALLKKELYAVPGADFDSLDLVYNEEGTLIAVFPVVTDEMAAAYKKASLLAPYVRYLNLAYFYHVLPQIGDPDMAAKWEKIKARLEKDMRAVYAFKGGIKNVDIWQINSEESPYIYVELDPWKMTVSSRELLDLKESRMYFKLESLPEKPDPVKLQLVLTVFPTVYSPAAHVIHDQDYYKRLCRDFDLRPGQETLVVGPGVGLEVWLAALKVKDKVYSIGINPFEVANLRYTAGIAGFEVEAKVGDNIISEEGMPRFENKQFDRVIWNMPVYQPQVSDDHKARAGGRLDGFWDGDWGGGTLKRFAGGLWTVLKPDGQTIVWNERSLIPTPDYRRIDRVKEILKSDGKMDVQSFHDEYTNSDTYFISRSIQVQWADGGAEKKDATFVPGGIDLRSLTAVDPGCSGTTGHREKLMRNKDKLLLSIARILRAEEDTGMPASPACKKLLVFLESNA